MMYAFQILLFLGAGFAGIHGGLEQGAGLLGLLAALIGTALVTRIRDSYTRTRAAHDRPSNLAPLPLAPHELVAEVVLDRLGHQSPPRRERDRRAR